MKKYIETLVGFLVILFIAVIIDLLRNSADVTFFMVMSVVCTFGITLIVYVPVARLIGALFIRLLKKIFKKEKNIEPIKPANKQIALIDYINLARKNKLADSDTKNNLKYQGGWQDKVIDDAFKQIDQNNDFFTTNKNYENKR
ncbi:hypothetical protein HN670_00265 [bacterium]|nr:hypothetical protein [bacterium]